MAKSDLVEQQKQIFDAILQACKKVSIWNGGDKTEQLIRLGYNGCFKQNGHFRKSALSWCGYVRRDGTIDENARLQCLQSAFCRMLRYHMGLESAYLGTIINATDNLASLAESFGLLPHNVPSGLWKLDIGSAEYQHWKPLQDENRIIARKFADDCDTFCQCMVYVVSKGKTSSRNGDIWRKALSV